jgi:hypothetical protein
MFPHHVAVIALIRMTRTDRGELLRAGRSLFVRRRSSSTKAVAVKTGRDPAPLVIEWSTALID